MISFQFKSPFPTASNYLDEKKWGYKLIDYSKSVERTKSEKPYKIWAPLLTKAG